MSDMKCPFCDSEIEQLNDQQRSLLHCSNIVCCKGGHYIGNISMWRDLIRTRKALDVVLDKLKRIQKIYTNAPFNAPINYANVCTDMYDVATEQIQELEQKD